ncbi:STAS domain-containing protein [Actinoplanes sp. NPDC051861]|uniref:STAS domain-containing protein n=1 Tax=Actinoplanes sp. NPDC051861 TaxID=3155170 RepID=UPI0034276B11
MTTQLRLLHGRRPDGAPALTAVGEIDMSNAATFSSALTEAVGQVGAGPLIVDLTAVEYIDSAGLAALFEHVERIQLRAGPLLAPVLTISGLTDLTTVDGV